MEKSLEIRPYARLLTMLGEQLIKNERIALIELIKNSYDADASWVKVTFENFGPNYEILEGSRILIEDNGHGMTEEIVEKHWLNPATPEKKNRKQISNTTESGRVIQGEKGIGRFAILKLGRNINVITRTNIAPSEVKIIYDFSDYDDEFLSHRGESKELFIDDLSVTLSTNEPSVIVEKDIVLGVSKTTRESKGTLINIANLKGSWTERKIRSVYDDLAKLQSIFDKDKDKSDFEVFIYKDDVYQNFHGDYIEKLNSLLKYNTVLRIEDGSFNSENLTIGFKENGVDKSLKISDPHVAGNTILKRRFGDGAKELLTRKIECGSFKFGFYVFDFSPQAPAKYALDKEDKKIIKEHRIYLYRDGLRVYPYGEQEDDWLRIDAYRGTISAGAFLSNDQVVGFVEITQDGNPKLKDKTNREGLIDEGNATEDFITILQFILAYIRQKPYRRYREELKDKKEHDIFRTNQVQQDLNELKEAIGDNKKASDILSRAEKEYKAERRYLTQRAETTEELAGVGLSVETASHDIMGMMGKVFTNIDALVNNLMFSDSFDKDVLLKELQSIRGGLSFIEAQLKDIQLLFKSSKQRRKMVRVKDIVEKVERIYKRMLVKSSIELSINNVGSPLMAKTTDAVLLQLLLNLFDNSVYWLLQTSKSDKKIEILLDGNSGKLIFSDNGPGINEDDIPYLFEPFYSGKGDEGRGLGLYIARQLLERQEYSIELAELKSERILSGANFVVNFFMEQ